MRGITRDCVVEMFDRKTVYLFVAVVLVSIVISLLSPKPDIEIQMQGNMDMTPMADWLRNPLTKALSVFLSFVLFLAVLATAGLVPNMLVKGRADFFLSKPLSRTALLLHKMLGIWVVYGAMVVLCGIAIYVTMLLRSNFFDWKVFYLFAFNFVSFFIWLSIIVTVGIVSGSGAISIMGAFLAWVAQFILSYHTQIKSFYDSKPVGYIVDTLYYIVPKTGEVSNLANALALGKPVESWMPLYSSLIFAVLFVILAIIVFKRKSY